MKTEALHCQADLLDRESVAREIAKINLTNIDDVILVHGVGKFKYEVESAIAALENLTPIWQEIDVYEPLPGFNPQQYYTNLQKIQSKWQRQTGIR